MDILRKIKLHEDLPDLLGGEINGHYHLTNNQYIKYDYFISFTYSGITPSALLYNNGDEWYEPNNKILYKLYDIDGVKKWINNVGSTGPTGYNGIDGATGPTGSGFILSYATCSLLSASWSGLSQSIYINGVTTTNDIMWTPSTLQNSILAGQSNLFCSEQDINLLTFQCSTTPLSNIDIKIKIIDTI